MYSKTKTAIIVVLAGFLVFVLGFSIADYFSEKRTDLNNTDVVNEEDVLYLHPQFPKNVIDGYILEINHDEGEIKLLALTENMLINPPRASREIVIKIDELTRFYILDFGTMEETETTFGEFKVWDDLAIATGESSLDLFKRDYFTARTITKRIGEPFSFIQ